MMNIAFQVPEEVARRLKTQWGDLPQRALEALAVDAYRSGILTAAEVQQMLQLSSRHATEAFLKQAGAYLDYTEADLEHDLAYQSIELKA